MQSNTLSNRVVWIIVISVVNLVSSATEPGRDLAMTGVSKRLLEAVHEDDDAAYRRAREEALRLPPDAFAALLQSLHKAGTWQAMAIHDALKLRREQPDLAADFDERLKEAIHNPMIARDGTPVYALYPSREEGTVRGLLLTPEHDTLRFEASVTHKKVHDPGGQYFRSELIAFSQPDEHAIRRYVALIEDMPEWACPQELTNRLLRVVMRSSGVIDPKVPRLLEIYNRLRSDLSLSGLGPAITLTRIIAHAAPHVSAPALKELRRFELMTMPQQGLEPWAVRNADELRNKTRETTKVIRSLQGEQRALLGRADDEEAIEALQRDLSAAEEQLQRDRTVLAAVRLWRTLEDAIAKAEAALDGNGNGRN